MPETTSVCLRENMEQDLKTLKKKILLVWFGLVFIFATVAASFLTYSRSNYIERAEIASQNITRILQQSIRDDIDVVDSVLQSTAAEYTHLNFIEHLGYSKIQEHLEWQRSVLGTRVAFLRITDKDGTIIFGINPAESITIADREHFLTAKNDATPKLIITKPILGRLTGKWTIYFARRLNQPDGSFAGIVFAGYHLETIANIFSQVNIGPGGSIVLRSADLGLVSRYPDVAGSAADIGKAAKTPPQLRAALTNGTKAGTVTLHSLTDNAWRISSFAHVTPYPFIIIAGHGLEEILKPWYLEVVGVCGLIVFVTFLLWLAAQRIHKDAIRQIHHIDETRAKEQAERSNILLQQRVNETINELRVKDQMLITQNRQATMGEMLNNIAHQWRQPLNGLSLLLSNLELTFKDNMLTEELFDKTALSADRLIQKMSTTIDDFRDFFSPDKIKTSFSALEKISRTIEMVEASYRAYNIKITVAPGDDCTLYGFPNEYSHVLLNILGNSKEAIVATGVREGVVSIAYGKDGSAGVVTVQDNGGGISEDIIERVFEPYFTTKEKGTGIGLYMSKMIIEHNMNGSIKLRNVENGCLFTIYVPLEGCHDK